MTQTKTRRPRRTYTDEFKNQLVQLYPELFMTIQKKLWTD